MNLQVEEVSNEQPPIISQLSFFRDVNPGKSGANSCRKISLCVGEKDRNARLGGSNEMLWISASSLKTVFEWASIPLTLLLLV
jgi:hypothetical protein